MRIDESTPKSIKKRIYRKVKPERESPMPMRMHGRIVPRLSADHTPRMYKHIRPVVVSVPSKETLEEADSGASDVTQQLLVTKEAIEQFRGVCKKMAEMDRDLERMSRSLEASLVSLTKTGKTDVGAGRTTAGGVGRP
ncbi:MAG: hypothetical protein Q8K86_08900 [Candidatus Nanopelagicaceae bacterium]|nr:hypothetical protein [Candidatus Nanopelagicaceae bacterium]